MQKVKSQFHLFFSLLIAILVLSCSKDSENGKSRSELIIGDWQVIKLEASPGYDYDGDGTADTDILQVWEDCNKDDYTSIKANSVYEVNRGTVKCFPSQQQLDIGSWQLAGDDKILVIDGTEQFEILQLDETTLKVKYTESINGTSITSVSTSTRK